MISGKSPASGLSRAAVERAEPGSQQRGPCPFALLAGDGELDQTVGSKPEESPRCRKTPAMPFRVAFGSSPPSSIAACSSASSGSTPVDGGGGSLPDGGAVESGSQPGDAGTMGGPCSATGTCGPGLTCVGPALVPGSAERYCAPSCATNADCQAFAQSSYELQLPDTFTPLGGSPLDTNWKTPADTGGLATLSRGVVCASSSGSGNRPQGLPVRLPELHGRPAGRER